MIRNTSYDKLITNQEIISLVGRPLKLSGEKSPEKIGLLGFKIIDASENLSRVAMSPDQRNYCSIELRPAGIVINFASGYETYAWSIAYYSLAVFSYKNKYSIHSGEDFIRIENQYTDKTMMEFMRKLKDMRRHYLEQSAINN